MLSGIGPADHLSSLHIPVVVDNPGVGAHLMDHPVIDFNFRDKTKSQMAALTGDPSRFNPVSTVRALAYLAEWKFFGTGPLSTNVRLVFPRRRSVNGVLLQVAEAAAFARSSDTGLFAKAGITLPTPDDLEDSTSGSTAPDIEIFFTPMAYISHGQQAFPEGHYFAVHAVLLRCCHFLASGDTVS